MTDTEPRSIEDIEVRLDEIRVDLQNLDTAYAGRKFSEPDRQRWNDLHGERDKLDAALVETRKRREALRKAIGNPKATERGASPPEAGQPLVPSASSASSRGLPSLDLTEDEARQLHAAIRTNSSVRLETRAVVTSALSGADQLAEQLTLRGRMSRRIAAAASIPSEPVAGITSKEFPVFGAGAAGITAEGVDKTEYDNIDPGSATPQMITIWTDTTRQNLLTMTNFEAKLRTVLSAKVAQREDLLLLSTVIGTSGILNPTGTLSADLVLEAAAMVAAGDTSSEPNLVAVNPADVPVLLGSDIGAGGSASPPFAQFLPRIHNMAVYPTNHVTAGEAVLGAWNVSSRFVVGVSPVFLVDATSGIKTNTVTILLEEAAALAVDEPQGFAHITAT